MPTDVTALGRNKVINLLHQVESERDDYSLAFEIVKVALQENPLSVIPRGLLDRLETALRAAERPSTAYKDVEELLKILDSQRAQVASPSDQELNELKEKYDELRRRVEPCHPEPVSLQYIKALEARVREGQMAAGPEENPK